MPTGFDLPLWIPHASVLLGMGLGVLAYLAVLVLGPIVPAARDADHP